MYGWLLLEESGTQNIGDFLDAVIFPYVFWFGFFTPFLHLLLWTWVGAGCGTGRRFSELLV